MMICKNCGADNDGGSRFCMHCGAPLTDVSAPAPQAAAGPIPVPLPDNTMTVLDHPPLPGPNDGNAYGQPGVPTSSGVAGAPHLRAGRQAENRAGHRAFEAHPVQLSGFLPL